MRLDHDALYIDGAWRPAGGGTVPHFSPADERRLGTVPLADRADVDDAVAAAGRASRSPEWGGLPAADRAALLERFADELAVDPAGRAALTSVQNGTPVSVAVPAEGFAPIALLRYFAGLARTTPSEQRQARFDGTGETIVRREPAGVIAAVAPWNFPQPLSMFKVAPALAAGCGVVLKPAPQTALGALAIAEAAGRAGLPAGALNVVTGGAEVGAHLVAHPGVDRVSFTGTTAVGRKVGEVCGRLLRPATLELSGRSAAIVLDDVDLAASARGLAMAALLNAGQTCYISSRILAPRSRYDEVVEAISAVAESLPIGDPLDPASLIGPLVDAPHRDRVQSYIDLGRAEGAVVATGATPTGHDRGWYVRPTVFADVDNGMRIAREEIFGPVVTVVPYRDEHEAVAIADDSEYGLGGTIWTADVERGLALARRLRTGTIGINFYDIDVGAPYGGVKGSGFGRELGPEGFEHFFQLKTVYLGAR